MHAVEGAINKRGTSTKLHKPVGTPLHHKVEMLLTPYRLMLSPPPTIESRPPPDSRGMLVFFLVCASMLVAISHWGGAFDSDLGGDPDEAAHAVTALMLRDYATAAAGDPPMGFARTYYEDFPRVALGHYPPLYYLVAAPLLLLGASVITLILLQAVTLAGLATLTVGTTRRLRLHVGIQMAAGGAVLALPFALKLAQHVMADILLAFLCLWAVVAWANYLRQPSAGRALGWGCIAAAAILTKGSGMGLCLLPPVASVLAGRLRLMATGAWWLSALPVVILAGPWMIYSTGISKEGMTLLSPLKYFMQAVPYYLRATPLVFGWPLTVAAALGVITGCKRNELSYEAASLMGMSVGMVAVLLLVPVGLSTRYMLTLAPVIVIAAAFGTDVIPWRGSASRFGKPFLLAAVAAVPLIWNGISHKEVHGFTEAVMRSGPPALSENKKYWLVASDPRGEGAIIAAAAFNCPHRSPSLIRIYRGSKELGSSDWMGRDYKAAFTQTSQMLAHLDEIQVSRVFIDLSVPAERRQPHERQLLAAMQSGDPRWRLDFEQPVTRQIWEKGTMLVYKRASPESAVPKQ